MTRSTRLAFAAFLMVTTLAMLGSNCPSIPSIEERAVELAVGGSATFTFEARGSLGTWSDTETINLAEDLDLAGILEDVDFDSVTAISLAGISYRVVRPDPDPDKAITSAGVLIGRGPTATELLVGGVSEDPVNAVTAFKTAPVQAAGVALINQMLEELLDAVRNGTPLNPDDWQVTGEGSGEASDGETNFDWELKLDINIVGVIRLDVLS